MKRVPSQWARIVLPALTLPLPAHAHLVTTGLGPYYDGITHFMISLGDVLPVLALALLAGLHGARAGRRTLFALPIAWFAAGLAAILQPVELSLPWLPALALLGLGGWVALDRRVPDTVITALALGLGLAGGYLSASSIAIEAELNGLAVIGACTALFAIVALAAAAAVHWGSRRGRIVFRVAGSWLAAIGLLQIGWWLQSAL
jgi:urease accessory protein